MLITDLSCFSPFVSGFSAGTAPYIVATELFLPFAVLPLVRGFVLHDGSGPFAPPTPQTSSPALVAAACIAFASHRADGQSSGPTYHRNDHKQEQAACQQTGFFSSSHFNFFSKGFVCFIYLFYTLL